MTRARETGNFGHLGKNENLLINGSFDIWQRGDSFLAGAQELTADRWRVASTANPFNVIRVYTDATETNRLRVSSTLGSTGGWVGQRIESINAEKLMNLRATVSIRMSMNVTQNVSIALYGTNVKDDWNSSNEFFIDSNTQLFNAGAVRTITFTTTNVLPDTVRNGLQVWIFFESGFAAGNVEAAELLDFKLEEGTVATGFEHRSYGEELALCQRYYEVGSYNLVFPSSIISGQGGNNIAFNTRIRDIPTMTFTENGHNGFPPPTTTVGIDASSFDTLRVADSANGGNYLDGWTADAEL